MKSQKLVSIFTVILKLILFVNILTGIALITVSIHSSFSPTTYEKLIIESGNFNYKLRYSSVIPKTMNSSEWNLLKANGKEIYYFTAQNISTRIRVLAIFLIQMTLVFLVFKDLLTIVNSLKKHQTLISQNSFYFKRISIYLGVYIIFNIVVNIIPIEFHLTLTSGNIDALEIGDRISRTIYKFRSFSLDFTAICFLFISCLFSVVFKEAERLRAENELTI